MKIPQEIINKLFLHAKEEAPLEACGYLAGIGDSVSKLYRMSNIDQSNVHFSFEPEEQFHVVKAARKEGIDLLAVYHSHPETPARPSKEDIRLAYDSSISHIIVSIVGENKEIKSFKINGKQITEEPIEIV